MEGEKETAKAKVQELVVLAAVRGGGKRGAPRSLSVLLPMRTWIPPSPGTRSGGPTKFLDVGITGVARPCKGSLCLDGLASPGSPWPLASPQT